MTPTWCRGLEATSLQFEPERTIRARVYRLPSPQKPDQAHVCRSTALVASRRARGQRRAVALGRTAPTIAADQRAAVVQLPWPCTAPLQHRWRRSRKERHGRRPAAADRIIWEPYGDYLEKSNVRRFMDTHGIATYDELVETLDQPTSAWFWDAALKDLGVEWDQPYDTVLDESRGFPWAKWFVGGKLNIVRNCLDRHASGHAPTIPPSNGSPKAASARTVSLCRARPRDLPRRQRDESCRRPPRRHRGPVHADGPRTGGGLLRGPEDRRRA